MGSRVLCKQLNKHLADSFKNYLHHVFSLKKLMSI